MQFHVLTLFPQMFQSMLSESMLKRAIDKNIISVSFHQIRDYAIDKHRTTDDLPYGGGAGMVMKCEPLYGAWLAAKNQNPEIKTKTILLTPQGKTLNQKKLHEWAEHGQEEQLILVCGRYEGIDERFIEECVDEEVSLGDFILSGGEIGALAIIDGIMRLIPGGLGNEESLDHESFSNDNNGLLEYPQYTRPPEFRGRAVPEVLLSGDHGKISKWRREESLERTKKKRPDLLKK